MFGSRSKISKGNLSLSFLIKKELCENSKDGFASEETSPSRISRMMELNKWHRLGQNLTDGDKLLKKNRFNFPKDDGSFVFSRASAKRFKKTQYERRPIILPHVDEAPPKNDALHSNVIHLSNLNSAAQISMLSRTRR